MPAPSSASEILRPDLADTLTEFDLAMDRRGFIGQQVLPVFETAEAAGTFRKIELEELLQNPETVRAPDGGYNRREWKFTEDTFSTQEHGLEERKDENLAKKYRNFLDFESVCVARAYDGVLRSQERRTSSKVFNTSTWTPSGVLKEWVGASDSQTAAKPIDDVEASVQRVWNACGLWANALIISRKVFRGLRNCQQIIDRIAGEGAGDKTKATDITPQMLALVFDLDYVLVAGSAQNTAAKGLARSISEIWDDEYAMVARIATTNDLEEPCLGRTFHWGEDGSTVGGTVEEYYSIEKRSWFYRVRHQVGEKILYPECADLMSNISA